MLRIRPVWWSHPKLGPAVILLQIGWGLHHGEWSQKAKVNFMPEFL
jgi:hypothetical protein